MSSAAPSNSNLPSSGGDKKSTGRATSPVNPNKAVGRPQPRPSSKGTAAAGSGGTGSNSKGAGKKHSSAVTASLLSRTRGVLDYLRLKVPKTTLRQLYIDELRGPFVCRAIVQQLSLPAQQIIIRLQCTGGSFALAAVKHWLSNNSHNNVLTQKILPELRQWAIIQEEDDAEEEEKASKDTGGEGEDGKKPSAAKQASQKQAEIKLTEEFRIGFTASLCRMHVSPWQPIPKDQLEAWERISALKQLKASSGNSNKRKQPSGGTPDPMGTVTPEDLERYTQTVWDSVLHFLVGTETMEPEAAVVHLLLQTGLMQPDPDYTGPNAQEEAPLVITEKGYDFMLQDNYEQVWHFCLQYLQVVAQNKEKGERMVQECLLLLICLSFCRNIGHAYLATSLNKSGRRMLKDLAKFGLLYVRELTVDDDGTSKVIFYPTRVAISLIGTGNAAEQQAMMEDGGANLIPASAQWSLSSKALEAALAHPTPHDSSHLAVIVQTNFQVCAYTTSELHVSMLALFCDVSTIRRLPNVVFLRMTRDSVKAAFHLGIQARQILRFLEKHAHPRLRVQNAAAAAMPTVSVSPIPSNVVDQVWLWDRERTRVQMTLVFKHQCLMEGEYEAVLHQCSNGNGLVWSSRAKKVLYLDYNDTERIQNFVKHWRARAARQAQRV